MSADIINRVKQTGRSYLHQTQAKKRVLTRKLKITLTNEKEKDNLAGTWAEDTTRKFTEEENITDNKTKIIINLSSYQENVLKTITPHHQTGKKFK